MAQPGRALVPRADREEPARGIFASVPDLIANIEHYLAVHNDDPSPTSGLPPPSLAKIQRARTSLDQAVNQN
jgi:hypothetical protein